MPTTEPEAALARVRELCRQMDQTGADPMCGAIVAVADIGDGVRLAAERLASPEAVRLLARSAATGAATQASALVRAHLYRTALLAVLALAVAVVAGFVGGYAARGGFRSACLEVGTISIDQKTGRPYCWATVWMDGR